MIDKEWLSQSGTGYGTRFGEGYGFGFGDGTGDGSGSGFGFGFGGNDCATPSRLRLDARQVVALAPLLGERADLPLDLHPDVVARMSPFVTPEQLQQALVLSDSLLHDELPNHHPLADARQTRRQFLEVLERTGVRPEDAFARIGKGRL